MADTVVMEGLRRELELKLSKYPEVDEVRLGFDPTLGGYHLGVLGRRPWRNGRVGLDKKELDIPVDFGGLRVYRDAWGIPAEEPDNQPPENWHWAYMDRDGRSGLCVICQEPCFQGLSGARHEWGRNKHTDSPAACYRGEYEARVMNPLIHGRWFLDLEEVHYYCTQLLNSPKVQALLAEKWRDRLEIRVETYPEQKKFGGRMDPGESENQWVLSLVAPLMNEATVLHEFAHLVGGLIVAKARGEHAFPPGHNRLYLMTELKLVGLAMGKELGKSLGLAYLNQTGLSRDQIPRAMRPSAREFQNYQAEVLEREKQARPQPWWKGWLSFDRAGELCRGWVLAANNSGVLWESAQTVMELHGYGAGALHFLETGLELVDKGRLLNQEERIILGQQLISGVHRLGELEGEQEIRRERIRVGATLMTRNYATEKFLPRGI